MLPFLGRACPPAGLQEVEEVEVPAWECFSVVRRVSLAEEDFGLEEKIDRGDMLRETCAW